MKLIKNNFRLWGIQPPPVLLDCLSALVANKGAFLLKRKSLFGEQFIHFFHFSYEILDYESKHLQIKTLTFPRGQSSEKPYLY